MLVTILKNVIAIAVTITMAINDTEVTLTRHILKKDKTYLIPTLPSSATSVSGGSSGPGSSDLKSKNRYDWGYRFVHLTVHC